MTADNKLVVSLKEDPGDMLPESRALKHFGNHIDTPAGNKLQQRVQGKMSTLICGLPFFNRVEKKRFRFFRNYILFSFSFSPFLFEA